MNCHFVISSKNLKHFPMWKIKVKSELEAQELSYKIPGSL